MCGLFCNLWRLGAVPENPLNSAENNSIQSNSDKLDPLKSDFRQTRIAFFGPFDPT